MTNLTASDIESYVNDRRSWDSEAALLQKLKKTQYEGLPPHSTGTQGAFARAMGRHDV